jgi:glycosyltransferase involved in cell wall biosynthesis
MGESRPRVLWVTPTLSSRFGGPTTTTTNGLAAEVKSGLPSEIATTIGPGGIGDSAAAVDRLDRAGVTVNLFSRPGASGSAETWGVSPKLAIWLLRKVSDYDVVHLQYVWCMSSIVACIAAKLTGVPVVVTPHESLTDYDIEVASRSRLKRLLKIVLKRFYLRTIDVIVFMSELEQRDTCSGDRRTVLISHAVCESAVQIEPSPNRRSNDPLRIGFLGRNIPKKGIDRLVEAIGRVPGRRWELLVAGPPGTPEFREQIDGLSSRLGVGDQVRWLGFLDRRDSLFASCDVLAMPSEYEGFGMVAAEAMANGLPVIVPKRSGVAEIVGRYGGGIVIDEPETGHLLEALKRFDEDREEWANYRQNGLRAAEERLTFSAYAGATAALYRTLT